MKIAYLLEWEFCKIDGVIKKVLNQLNSWRNLGIEVEIFALSRCKDIIKIDGIKNYDKDILNLIYHKPLYNDLKAFNPDIVYFRFNAYKPYLEKIFSDFKCVIELNTNDVSEAKSEINKGFKYKLIYQYMKLTINRMLNKLPTAVIGVTHEIANLVKDKPTEVVPNSINLEAMPILKNSPSKNEIPNLFFISSPHQPWQGVDKLIYLAKQTQGRLKLHIIGEEKPEGLELDNIKFYGFLSQEEYREIAKKCDIAIGSLAIHRRGMVESCSLKVRESLSLGLPLIIAYEETPFIDKEFDWLLKLENSEDNVKKSIEKIVDFCYKNIDRVVQKDEIREYIDSKVLEKKRVDYLKFVAKEIKKWEKYAKIYPKYGIIL